MMGLKAIASSSRRRGSSRWRSDRPRKRRRPSPCAWGSVRDAVRLVLGSWCGAGRRLSSGRPGGHPVFLMSSAKAVPGPAAERRTSSSAIARRSGRGTIGVRSVRRSRPRRVDPRRNRSRSRDPTRLATFTRRRRVLRAAVIGPGSTVDQPQPSTFEVKGAAAQPESWPVGGPLATEVGICGQIGGNPLVIQMYLATSRRAEKSRNRCLRAVIRGCRPHFL